MVKKIIHISIWVLTAAALIALFVVAREDYLTSPVKDVHVNIGRESDRGFIQEQQFLSDIEGIHKNSDIGTVNMAALQKYLENNPWIESGNSYIDLEGNLCINLKEYHPVMRIFDNKGRSIYLTDEGISVPTNKTYTSHVLIANGNFTLRNDSTAYPLNDSIAEDRTLMEALHLYKAINNNAFMKSCIGQVYRNKKGSFDIVVKGIEAQVIIGDTCRIDDKLRRAEIFFKQKAESNELNSMKSINLKYKNQVVCTKR